MKSCDWRHYFLQTSWIIAFIQERETTMTNLHKRALVLSGGGGRGAYHVGVYKYLSRIQKVLLQLHYSVNQKLPDSTPAFRRRSCGHKSMMCWQSAIADSSMELVGQDAKLGRLVCRQSWSIALSSGEAGGRNRNWIFIAAA
jgi:hypothetical protein